jgi:hypothetical protein
MNKYLLILLMLSSANACAELNKWIDESGKVHYSDQPPPLNVKARTLRSTAVTSPADAAASAPAAPKTIAEREAEWKKEQREKQSAADKAAKEQARKEERKNNCALSQQNLKTYQADVPVAEINAQGERVVLDDSKRQQRIAKAQQDVNTWCK